PPPAASASASASASAAGAPADSAGDEDEIKPAYPLNVTPQPLAQRFCEAMHELPAKRKAECCSTSPPAFSITSECVRTLSFAIQTKSVARSGRRRSVRRGAEQDLRGLRLGRPQPAARPGCLPRHHQGRGAERRRVPLVARLRGRDALPGRWPHGSRQVRAAAPPPLPVPPP